MSEGKYDTFLQVRLTTHDKERIKTRAIEAGMQTSEYVRKRALGERVVPPREIGARIPLSASGRHMLKEIQASVALDGETMHAEHPAVKRAEREQAERNVRGAVVEECETVEALPEKPSEAP